jgi:hypothetical protein
MDHNTILYISDQENHCSSLLPALKEAGCQVVSTSSPTEGIALLYVMRSVAAVVLDRIAAEHASFNVAQRLREIRPNVPVVLQCGDETDRSPSSTESCVNRESSSDNFSLQRAWRTFVGSLRVAIKAVILQCWENGAVRGRPYRHTW